jgi:hypothetical protein
LITPRESSSCLGLGVKTRQGPQSRCEEHTFQPPTKTPRTMPPGRRRRSACPLKIHSIL